MSQEARHIIGGAIKRGLKPGVSWIHIAGFVAVLLSTLASASGGEATASLKPDAEERTQRIFETRLYLADLVRFQRVAYAVLRAASPYCVQDRKYSLGIPPLAATDLPEDLRAGLVYLSDAKLSSRPRFMTVHMLSPLRSAGVRDGDQMLSMTDSATGKSLGAGWYFERPANTLVENADLNLELIRAGGKIYTVAVHPQLICSLTPTMSRQDELVARATAEYITVSTGLLRFISNDDELALLLSNEIAHRILPRMSSSVSPHKLPARLQQKYSPQQERSADYLGAYITHLAGFDAERGMNVWRLIASNPPSRVRGGLAARHPLTGARTDWQRSTLAEIRYKKMNGMPLVPDRKSLPTNLAAEIVAADEPIPHTTEQSTEGVDPRLNRVADVPFIDNEGRSGYQRFLNTPLRPRAFAISPSGSTWSYRVGTNAAAEALKTCTTPTAPCYLYAIDDRVVWNPETVDRVPLPSSADVDPRLNRVAEVPFMSNEGRAGYERFLNQTVRPRAFAIGPKGNGTAAWAYRSGVNAPADALARCMVLSHGLPCYLYAVDDRVVWTLQNAPAVPQTAVEGANSEALRHPSASGFADLNDLSAIPLAQDQLTNYRAFLEKPAPRAFVISQEGFGRYWLGSAAMEDALSYCERLGEPCWLYAVDNDVVWQDDKTKRISRRAQLPRQSDEIQFLK